METGEINADLSSFFVLSDDVVALGASMQHIFPNAKAKTTNATEKTNNEKLKSTCAFSSCSENFCLAVRTSHPDRIGS